ncbi:unnamed protein product [Phytophthora fragariaefolia]|uniref:Unnamed protein product n=1 Tax=Phytophthora fragariaefolia TaxID=1490495 RepID=A0A9W6TQV2_9STRA|nr:unnamed protein product [Phytophthora fragariaefolia]
MKGSAKIVHTTAIETGVAKVITGTALSTETAALKRFDVQGPAGKERKETEGDYTSLLLIGKVKRRKGDCWRHQLHAPREDDPADFKHGGASVFPV